MSTSDLNNINKAKFNRQNLFDRRQFESVPYKTSEVDAVIGYFSKRGFDQVAAVNTALVLLRQASIDKLPAFELIDTLKGVSNIQLSNIVAQILNLNRSKTTTLGFRVSPRQNLFDQRNIVSPATADLHEIQLPQSDYIETGYVEPGYVE